MSAQTDIPSIQAGLACRLKSQHSRSTPAAPIIGWSIRMRLLSFVYRFISNFAFLAVVYLSLNFMETYHNRAIIAILVLVYTGMRAVSTLRSFYFFQKIERLEAEIRRLMASGADGAGITPARKQSVSDVSGLRRDAEMKAYMDLFFLACIVLLCVAKIVTE
jgi:hypothetical protein